MAQMLQTKAVEKPWGKSVLPPAFVEHAALCRDGGKIGEVWYEGREGQDLPLMVKYIFTSERLSIQVHPNNDEARSRGLTRGKEEAWYILDCEPDARLGIGLIRPLTTEEFRAAALDGSLEDLIDWKPVKPGDCYFIPAGTVHAIGAGITLAEVQQNADVTYRIYDYGRPRELHLDHGLAVSQLMPYGRTMVEAPAGRAEQLVCASEAPFWLHLASWAAGETVTLPASERIWFTPLDGSGTVNGEPWRAGQCWLLDGESQVVVQQGGSALLAGEKFLTGLRM